MVIFHMEMTRCVVIHKPPVHQWGVGRSPKSWRSLVPSRVNGLTSWHAMKLGMSGYAHSLMQDDVINPMMFDHAKSLGCFGWSRKLENGHRKWLAFAGRTIGKNNRPAIADGRMVELILIVHMFYGKHSHRRNAKNNDRSISGKHIGLWPTTCQTLGGHHFVPPRVWASSALGAAPALPDALRVSVSLRALLRRRPSELSLHVPGPRGVQRRWMAVWLWASLFGGGDSTSGGLVLKMEVSLLEGSQLDIYIYREREIIIPPKWEKIKWSSPIWIHLG